jgi:hypothetical protein
VARAEPYRVDWWSPAGGWVHGKPLPFKPVKLDADERKRYMEARVKGTGKPAKSPDEVKNWADAYPAFDASGLGDNPATMPDGRLLIRRYPIALDSVLRYDIVNRKGELEAQLVIKENEKVIGFGSKSIYIVEEDADGVTWLRRHPWSRGG